MIRSSSTHDQSDDTGESFVAEQVLVEAPWSVWPASGLVIAAFVLTLLTGACVAAARSVGWGPVAQTIVAATCLVGLYATLMAIVWATATSSGARFVDAVGLRQVAEWRWYGAALGAAVVGWLFSAAFTAALKATGVNLPREDLAVFRLLPAGLVGTAITIVLLVVVAPLAEEVVYRGVLLPSLSARWGAVIGLALSTAVFSAVHLSVVGFVPLLVSGGLFGWLFLKSRSLVVSIVAHAAYNALGVVALFASKALGLS